MEFSPTSDPATSEKSSFTPESPSSDLINTLPNEVLLRVFSYLPARDQLRSRAVCLRWASFSSNSITFALSPSTAAYSTLLSSGVIWTRVQISGLECTSESEEWLRSLTSTIGTSIRSLVLRNSRFTREFLQSQLLTMLPNLNELEFIECEMEEENMQGVEAGVNPCWENFLRTRLQSLTVEVGNSRTLNRFFNMFTCPGACLSRLVIRSTGSGPEAGKWFTKYRRDLDPILACVRNSCMTLQHLSFESWTVFSLERFWYALMGDLDYEARRSLRLRTLDVGLRRPPDSIITIISTVIVPELYSFLSINPQLTSVSLPPIFHRDMPGLLPSLTHLNLQKLTLAAPSAFLLPPFPLKLLKLNVLNLIFFPTSYRENVYQGPSKDFRKGLEGRVLPQLQTLTATGWIGPILSTLTKSFPNLTKLVLICAAEEGAAYGETLNDTELQILIPGLPRLQSLRLSPCTLITDFGVTGLALQMGREQNRADQGRLHSTSVTFIRLGHALHDLKDLEELNLEGSSQISDVGLAYGFRFRNLERLHLSSAHPQVTGSGLVRLAEVSPRLERLTVETTSHLLTEEEDREKIEKEVLDIGVNSGLRRVTIRPLSI